MKQNCRSNKVFFLAALLSLSCLQSASAAPVIPHQDEPESLIDVSERSAPVSTTNEEVPPFLLDVYECWSNGDKDCLSEADPEVNVVRSLVGKFDEEPPRAILRSGHSREVLTDSISFIINSSSSDMISQDVLHRALLRVYKTALSQDEISTLQSDCDLTKLELKVYSTVNVNSKNEDVVVLEKSIPITFSDLSESKWLSFPNMKHVYQSKLQQSQSLRLYLTIGGYCQSISPSKFGFTTSLSSYQPELVGYVKNGVQDEKILSSLKNMQYNRRKRQTEVSGENGSGVGSDFNNDTKNYTTFETREPSNVDEYKKARCHFYEFNVSFVEINWEQYIVRPLTYKANFCAGTCKWPLEDPNESPVTRTKHSFIQSIVNLVKPDLVPPPCCAPPPGSLLPLTVVTRDGQNNFSVHRWADMIATSCGCL